MAQNGTGGFFPTNPDLADVLGKTDLDVKNFYFLDLLDPKFLDFQVPRFPDAAGASGRTLRSQLDSSPNAPRDQIRRKEPLLRFVLLEPSQLQCFTSIIETIIPFKIFWVHDGFLYSRWILIFTMDSWIHAGFLDAWWIFGSPTCLATLPQALKQ